MAVARRTQRIGDESGMALLFVLLIVTLLSALVLELSHDTLVDLRLAETFRDRTQAGYIARGGIVAGQMLLQEDNKDYDHLNEPWALGVSNYPVDEGSVSIEITDLGGRLVLNNMVTGGTANSVYKANFRRLLEHLGEQRAEELTDALIDWLDFNDGDEPEDYGAENDYYRSLTRPYACKNGPLDSFEELAQVRGYTAELLRKLRPHVALQGADKINVNTASPEVLASLALDKFAAADDVLSLGEAEELVAQLRAEPITDLSQLSGLANGDVLNDGAGFYLAVKSNTFRIISRGDMNDAARFATAEFDRDNKKLYYLRLD